MKLVVAFVMRGKKWKFHILERNICAIKNYLGKNETISTLPPPPPSISANGSNSKKAISSFIKFLTQRSFLLHFPITMGNTASDLQVHAYVPSIVCCREANFTSLVRVKTKRNLSALSTYRSISRIVFDFKALKYFLTSTQKKSFFFLLTWYWRSKLWRYNCYVAIICYFKWQPSAFFLCFLSLRKSYLKAGLHLISTFTSVLIELLTIISKYSWMQKLCVTQSSPYVNSFAHTSNNNIADGDYSIFAILMTPGVIRKWFHEGIIVI